MSVQIPGRLKGEGDLLDLTSVRHRELRTGLEEARRSMALALRRGTIPPSQHEDISQLRDAVSAALHVLDNTPPRGHRIF